jgi:hypothetical protein
MHAEKEIKIACCTLLDYGNIHVGVMSWRNVDFPNLPLIKLGRELPCT